MSFDGIIAHHLWNETPFDPIGASAFRRKVEPWLSAIFQTEHLSLLEPAGEKNHARTLWPLEGRLTGVVLTRVGAVLGPPP